VAFELFILCLWFVFLASQQRLLDELSGRGVISSFTARKISHLAVGLWVIPLAIFVHRPYLAAIPITMILAANVRANSQRGSHGRIEKRLFAFAGFLLPLLLIMYFWHRGRSNMVVLAVLAMTMGDTAAAYAGSHLGKHRIPWNGKTVEGGIANFIVTLAVLAGIGQAFYDMPLAAFSVPAAVAALLEAVIPGEWDNPLAVVTLLLLLKPGLN